MSLSDEASGQLPRHRTRDLLIEIAVVAVLGAHLAAFLAIRSGQSRYADEAREIAAWAEEHDVSRIAWPTDLRAAVPALLEAGITPVLVDPSERNAQQLVVNRTPVLVARDLPDDVDGLATDRFQAGALDAALVDLDAAGPMPLEVGEAVEVEYSRPYRYAPIRDSHLLVVGEQLDVPVTLAPGSYRLTSEVADPEAILDLTLSATLPDGIAAWFVYPLEPRVYEPQVLDVTVAGSAAEEAVLRLEVWPRPGTDPAVEGGDTAILHGWTLERTA